MKTVRWPLTVNLFIFWSLVKCGELAHWQSYIYINYNYVILFLLYKWISRDCVLAYVYQGWVTFVWTLFWFFFYETKNVFRTTIELLSWWLFRSMCFSLNVMSFAMYMGNYFVNYTLEYNTFQVLSGIISTLTD